MTATNHVLTGIFIANAVQNPWIALPVALASHFVLDAIPHFGMVNIRFDSNYFKVYLLCDMVVAALVLAALVLIMPQHIWLLMACGILGASPDLMWIPKFLAANQHKSMPKSGVIRKFHTIIQWFERPIGWVVEVAWFIAMTLLLNAQLLIIH
ncbi:MAG TPA: hypothetical protein VJC09_03285 [Candidatus Saccharimonadales bacterium]|nr:hypothetical protein [Candidatus Saccharimonadales bacterium]